MIIDFAHSFIFDVILETGHISFSLLFKLPLHARYFGLFWLTNFISARHRISSGATHSDAKFLDFDCLSIYTDDRLFIKYRRPAVRRYRAKWNGLLQSLSPYSLASYFIRWSRGRNWRHQDTQKHFSSNIDWLPSFHFLFSFGRPSMLLPTRHWWFRASDKQYHFGITH